RRSSVAPRIRLAFATRPYRRIIDDHREAARSLRRYGGALRKRLRYRPATPSSGTQPVLVLNEQQPTGCDCAAKKRRQPAEGQARATTDLAVWDASPVSKSGESNATGLCLD